MTDPGGEMVTLFFRASFFFRAGYAEEMLQPAGEGLIPSVILYPVLFYRPRHH